MDRSSKTGTNRGQKKMSAAHLGSEFFALGTKGVSGGGTRDDPKSKIVSIKGSSSGSGVSSVGDRKREASTSLSNTSKKSKISNNPVGGGGLRSISGGAGAGGDGNFASSLAHDLWLVQQQQQQQHLWEHMATECEPVDLVDTIYAAMEQNDHDTVTRLLCGAITHLTAAAPIRSGSGGSNTNAKLDPILFLELAYVVKMRPSYFCSDIVTSALISVLRRGEATGGNAKTRHSSHAHILASNLLARGYDEHQQWPDLLLRCYIEDAINERVWADNELCAPFIENVCAVFRTRTPTYSLQMQSSESIGGSGGQHRSDLLNTAAAPQFIVGADDGDSGDNSVHGADSAATRLSEFGGGGLDSSFGATAAVVNRYAENEQNIEKYVTDAIKDQLNKRQQQDCYTRNFLKFLCTTAGLAEVRYLCTSRLELWIHNGKLVKFAQQLLSYICFNISSNKNFKDNEVLAVLVKMRLKTKPLINFYMSCLKEMILLQPDILCIVLKLVVQNELSNTRNPNNMGMLATMFQTSPEQSASHLAEIYKEFVLQRDDCLRTLRVFLRELVRMLRFDINIVTFCKVFLHQRPDLTKQIEQSEFKDRIFYSMVDITCLCMLLSVSPQVREASMSLRTSRDMKSNSSLIKFYIQMSQIQLDAVSWMYDTVPNIFKLQATDYNQALHKLLLLENPEVYSRCDQWPSEPERATLLRMVSETPIHEEALLRIILIGITKDIPFTIPDTIDIIMLVIKRASAMRIINYPAVQANKFEIIDFLFSMAEYHHPENIQLPVDYDPPKLAITVLYWKAWLIMLMISAHNPSTFGAFCWDHYPTMKMLIEMCITSQFNENFMAKNELQIIQVERDHILEFESYLAAQTSQAIITEDNAILISQLMLMDPMGNARRIPTVVLDQLKYLNKSLKLGHLLCRSRKPDLLLDIIQRQGTTQSMPWLSDLVQNSEGDFNHLPVQCLCEFLLFNANNINEENTRDAELVNFLRNLIIEPDSNKQTVCEVLDYIFRRLSSTVKQSRIAALEGIRIIFKFSDLDENDWLLRSIPQIPHFEDVRGFIIPQLRSACQVENSPELVMSYIQFIAAHTLNDPVTDMLDHVIDMAQLIVERSTMFQYIIPTPDNAPFISPISEGFHESRVQTLKCLFVMFNNYIIKLREHHEPYEWTEYPDLLMVQFDDGMQLPLHLNIIHAFIILLTHSSKDMSESIPILDYWFPQGRNAPVAYLPNMPHEPVQLLPDWLKLKMIRSPVDRLIEAALQGLTPDQIVLFVQNFGTPINSMSKLLTLLDCAIEPQGDAVKNAILNKAYLAQLIEIQQARGAKNGHYTIQTLDLHSHSQCVPDLPKLENYTLEDTVLTPIEPVTSKSKTQTTNDVIQLVLKGPELNRSNGHRFRKVIYQFLENSSENSSADDMADNKSIKRDSQYTSNKVLAHLTRFIEISNIPTFSLNIFQKQHSCTFFRAILKNNPVTAEDCAYLFNMINNAKQKSIANIESRGEFATILFQYYSSLQSFLHYKNNLYETKKLNSSLVINVEKETLRQMLVHSKFFQSKCKDGSLICNDTENNYENSDILYRDGPLVDWLAETDPELKTVGKKLQINFLFSKKCGDFRFYLLSLLCHQTNWETLISTLNYLLQQPNQIDFDCSTVLNFIDSLINNPKLWQGRDKCVSKTGQPENILSLKENEINTLAQLILNEEELHMDASSAKYDYKLCSRIDLLFRITGKNSANLVKFIEYVSINNCPSTLRLKVLQQMYLMYPSIKFMTCNQAVDHGAKLQTLKGCQADKVSNYLITGLGNLFSKKDFEALSSDTELLMRKLAASHPALFRRQLGVLSSLIQGRAQINLRALRDEYHFHRFIQILRTLELLQPIIFDDAYKHEFQTALECYFTFFKHHSYVKETYHILIKFVEILQSYINLNPASALLFIEQYVGILMELAAKFNSVASLHKLVQGIALLKHKTLHSRELNEDEIKQDYDLEDQTTESSRTVGNAVSSATDTDTAVTEVGSISSNVSQLDINSRGVVTFAISGSQNKSTCASPHFLNLIKIIKHSSAEDAILIPLQEIESLTSKRFSFLCELFDRLLELIFSPSAQIRSNAFILLIRHLKHNPGRSDINSCTLNAYIQCLRDDNSSVAATAVDNLAEMILLLQEHAIKILSVAFSLGMRSRLNTSTQIKRVLQTLLLQHGY